MHYKKYPVFHDRNKHINTIYHLIRECIMNKEVQLNFVNSQDQIIDIFTKSPKFEDFRRLIMLLGVANQV